MRALVVYCHPRPKSFNAAVRDQVLAHLSQHGTETRLIDLYAQGFDPVLTANGLEEYEDEGCNTIGLESEITDLQWCDTLIFVYPTWWYGLPAMLKGWLDRVLVPGVAFKMPDAENKDIRAGLTHIKQLGVFTTCGASWWLTQLVGAPGRRTILRGLKVICGRPCKTLFVAHYSMDSSTPESRAAHLEKVTAKLEKFLGPAPIARKGKA